MAQNDEGARPRLGEVHANAADLSPENIGRDSDAETVPLEVFDRTIAVNGLYRHGFLVAPALAELTLAYVERGQIDNEVMRCA